ncbi:PREDICTED: uncharacterized protein LOC105560024 [Vollenhovia emeryi]|uniref:uncharacterized protein LOC105560024 n=1 Tax=Vollenhovia emeryi TaxID=411798 RepID=UPI0005F3E99F|nr:PREDICTED: uncharacterized protein LOC105560024 [Vollenhovia emeryi]
MPKTLQLGRQTRQGKLEKPSRLEAVGVGDKQKRLHVYDRTTGRKFLVDTGADVSIIPVSSTNRKSPTDLKLYSANNTAIKTYGEMRLTLNLGLRRPVTWNFCVADIPFAILGADILSHYRLSVNLHDQVLIDQVTSLKAKGKVTLAPALKVSVINYSSDFAHIFAEFPTVTGVAQDLSFVPRAVNHQIFTTGPPVTERSRRLPPEKLSVAKAEFKRLMELGLCRSSSSP